MKKNCKYLLLPALFLALISGCQLFQAGKKAELPPITMEGKNTFGCLFNNEVWKPKGFDGYPNRSVWYNSEYEGGSLQIKTYRIVGRKTESITLGGADINGTGEYSLSVKSSVGIIAVNDNHVCYYTSSEITYQTGSLIITEINLEEKFISGTFEFTVVTATCDTIRVRDGRFDLRL